MFSSAEKTNRSVTAVQKKAQQQTFFRKAGEDSFFGTKESPSFFSTGIQAKLSVSSPDDPQEKEADAIADHVMRMPEPSAAPEQKKEEEIQRKEEDLRSVASAKEGEVQPKLFKTIQRSEDTPVDSAFSGSDTITSSDNHIDRKNISLHHSDVIQRSGRGPPTGSIPFEQSLTSSKGGGSALPDDTKQFMESRFQSDFSGVRIHTGSYAEGMSSQINAQAFTHGNDIYFNAGKYSPSSAGGSTLLAHELTHTIQQGASKPVTSSSSTSVSPKPLSVSRKARLNGVVGQEIIHRSADGVPVQLTNAVAKAKSMEGKINAKVPGPDGYRTGWQHLLEIFKSTFGEDKIISGSGGTIVPGTVAEEDIKKYREAKGVLIVDPKNTDRTMTGNRDSMPSWCGIFVFWALNKSGVPMPKWELGKNVIKPEAINPPGYIPKPGDIAWRKAYSHFAIVESVSGETVKTINGNTAGTDNLGGQVQTVEHKLDNWTAFFSPLMTATGPLSTGEAPVNSKPKSFKELRKELFRVNRKEQNDHEEEINSNDEKPVQAKQELSNWSVDNGGNLQTGDQHTTVNNEKKIQSKEEEKKQEDDKQELTNQPDIQKKQDYDIHRKCSECEKEEKKVQPKYSVHRKTETADSSLNEHTNSETAEQNNEMDRGPPVQAKINSGNSNIIQRSVIDDALEFAGSVTDCITTDLDAAKKCGLQKAQQIAMHIPGYKALRVVLGEDPITGDDVERNGKNFIEAAFDIMPGGSLLHKKLQEQHQLDAAAAWIDGKIAEVETLVNGLFSAITRFWDSLGVTDFTSPLQVLRNGVNIVLGFISSVIDFAVNAAKELLEMIKKFLLDKIVEFIKEKTTAYPLLTVILGEDPVTKQKVARNGTNILNALLELGGDEGKMQRDQMKDTGSFQKIAGYIDEGIKVFGNLYDTIVNGFSLIWDIITIDALMEPVATFTKIYNIFADPVKKVLDFVKRVVAEILKLIKEVLFKRISAEAKKVRGYFLMTVIINKDPFTGEVVPRSVENIIHGFMSLMDGGEEQFQQMKESGAIAKAVGKINAAVKRLNMTLASIIQLFIDLWNSFTFKDFLHPIDTFKRIIAKFGEPIGRLIAFIIEIVKIVVEVILIIMNFPFDLINNIIAKAMQAFELIKKDPIGFLKNLLRAIKEGFMQFFDNILTHLFNGLKTWFLGEVQAAGIPIPTDFSVMGIIKWLLAVLDITMEKIWKKLEDRIGKPKVDKIKKMIDTAERIADAAGEAYQFMKDVQERGFMAVMIDKVKEQLSNVWEMVLDAVKSFVMDQIVKKVTAKLLSMLDPTGIMAVINSAIALYKAIQSFIKYLRKMLEIVNSFVEGTLQIAQGATKKAADFLEGALANGIPIVIGFLANQVGLNLSERLKDALELVREKVDKGLTWVIDKLVGLVEKLVTMGKAAIASILKWLGLKKDFDGGDGKHHKLYFSGSEENPVLMVQSNPIAYQTFIGMVDVGDNKEKETAKKSALGIAKDIDKKRRAPLVGDTEEAKEKSKEEKIKEVEKLLNDLSVPTAVLFGDPGAAGEPEVLNTTQAAGHAITMSSKKLNKKQTLKGSPPTASNTASYDVLNTRRQSASASYYVKGHMLNDNIGGKGVWENLTPLSREGNSAHEGNVESLVKAAYNSGAVVEYNVKANYGYGNNASSIPADDPQSEQKLKIITEEKNVPTELECEAWMMEKKGDKFERTQNIVTQKVPNPIGQDAASYVLDGSPGRTDIFLNSSDITVIATIENFADMAEKVELAHTESGKSRFNSYTELSKAKMKDGNTEIFNDTEKARVLALGAVKYVKLYKGTV